MIDRPRTGERTLLVQVGIGASVDDDQTDEFEELARSAGALTVGHLHWVLRAPQARYLAGRGKVDELAETVAARDVEVVIVDHALSPSQERNLEKVLKCRVLDRTGLILDIFAQRARSFEGKLQVELAQLRHLSTRLIRGWTHLERQKGGIGLRGPGETQLETDRRLLGLRIKALRRRLEKVSRQREQGRRHRRRSGKSVMSLVGYTNAGKSTLFNALTGAGVYSADQLFATLDPTLRGLDLPHGESAILADTVGFVRELPHELVAAFRATLEETREAGLLLHVIDAADPERRERIEQVNAVLREIGAHEVPQIRIYNKIDLSGDEPRTEQEGSVINAWVSAATGAGLDELREALAAALGRTVVRGRVHLPAGAGRARARFYAAQAVQSEQLDAAGGIELKVELPEPIFQRICLQEGLNPDCLVTESVSYSGGLPKSDSRRVSV